jgi:hypothetical protein
VVLKKIIFIISISITFLFSSEIEAKLYDKLFTTLFSKNIVKIYTENPEIKKLKYKNIVFVDDCKKADIVIGKIKQKCNKPVFVLSFKDYKHQKNAIGAFYWRKGRPQLRLRWIVIKKYHLYLSNDFKDFVDEIS